MLTFPDPNVETEYTDPNGSVWEFNGTGWVRQPDCPDGGGGGSGDTYWPSVRLLINADGEPDGSQNIVDATTRNGLIVYDQARVSTSEFKYGTGSVDLTASDGSFVEVPRASWLTLDGPFTIEFWMYATAFGGTDNLICNSHGPGLLCFHIHAQGGNRHLNFSVSHDGTSPATQCRSPNDVLETDTWHHVAACWDGSNYMLFLDGELQASTPSSEEPYYLTAKSWVIGAKYNSDVDQGTGANSRQPFTGYLDDIRVTIGECRYDGSFTPPSQLPTRGVPKEATVVTVDPALIRDEDSDVPLTTDIDLNQGDDE